MTTKPKAPPPTPEEAAQKITAMPGLAARKAVTETNDIELLNCVRRLEVRQLVLDRVDGRLRRLTAPAALPKVKAPEPEPQGSLPLVPAETAPEPEVIPEPPAAAELSEPQPPAAEAAEPVAKPRKSRAKANAELGLDAPPGSPDEKWECTRPGCGFVGDPDDDFGWRTYKGRVYRQPQCRPCRRAAAKVADGKRQAARRAAAAVDDNPDTNPKPPPAPKPKRSKHKPKGEGNAAAAS